MKRQTVIGVDVGGTFTDLVLFDGATGRFSTAKTPSQRGNEAKGFIDRPRSARPHRRFRRDRAWHDGRHQRAARAQGRARRRSSRRRDFATCSKCAAATGRAPGACAAISVPSSIAISASKSPSARSPTVRYAWPSIRRKSRRARANSRRKGAEALAIVFINAYANPANERAAVAAARAVWPNEHVIASHEILPEIREFERASTTALNAYLQPVVGGYLNRLQGALAERDFSGDFHIVQSNGGVTSVDGRAQISGAHRALRPGRGRHRGLRDRESCGLRQCDHRRSRRHFVRRFVDRQGRSFARRADDRSISASSSARR